MPEASGGVGGIRGCRRHQGVPGTLWSLEVSGVSNGPWGVVIRMARSGRQPGGTLPQMPQKDAVMGIRISHIPRRLNQIKSWRSLFSQNVLSRGREYYHAGKAKKLSLIREDLTKEKIPFLEITGATKKEERIRLVREFNENPDIPIFLISLKAGGTGLNLTGADVVIHYDPWWNTSAEDQATDRTHRIGQKNVVTVYKMVIKNRRKPRSLLRG